MVVNQSTTMRPRLEKSPTVVSLERLLDAIEDGESGFQPSFVRYAEAKDPVNITMPPMEVAVTALRWANGEYLLVLNPSEMTCPDAKTA